MAWRDAGVGRTHAGEGDLTIVANDWAGGGPVVIVAPGAGQSHATYAHNPAYLYDLDLLAELWGCCVVIADLGGNNTWGLDVVVHPTTGRTREAIDYAGNVWGADTTRVALIGDSMGAMNMLGYHCRTPGTVSCTVARLPVVAADALHDREPAGLGVIIDAAYGSSANWEADKANRDPSAAGPAELIAGFADDVLVCWSTDDPTILPADITSFRALTGVRTRAIGAIGHSLGSVNGYDQGRFIADRLGI